MLAVFCYGRDLACREKEEVADFTRFECKEEPCSIGSSAKTDAK